MSQFQERWAQMGPESKLPRWGSKEEKMISIFFKKKLLVSPAFIREYKSMLLLLNARYIRNKRAYLKRPLF